MHELLYVHSKYITCFRLKSMKHSIDMRLNKNYQNGLKLSTSLSIDAPCLGILCVLHNFSVCF